MRAPAVLLLLLFAAPAGAAEPSYWGEYGVDWATVVLGAGSGVGFELIEPREDGPGPFDERPHQAADTITISRLSLALLGLSGGAAALGGLTAPDGDRAGWRTHDAFLGYLETMAVTAALTNGLKAAIAAKRPDYADRVRQGVDEAALRDGRKSTPSGHASFSFAGANYLALQLGSAFVWRDERHWGTRAAGAAGMLALWTGAGLVAASRVEDGRHHAHDVLAGAGLGLAVSTLFWWRYFELGTDDARRSRVGVSTGEVTMITTAGSF